MSIFNDKNIESELLIKQVYDVRCAVTGFTKWEERGTLIKKYFFKHLYNKTKWDFDSDKVVEEAIKTIGNLPARLVDNCFNDNQKPLCRKFKRFIKHEYVSKFVYERDLDRVVLYIEERLNFIGEMHKSRIGFIILKHST